MNYQHFQPNSRSGGLKINGRRSSVTGG